jgi:hypothetical protein
MGNEALSHDTCFGNWIVGLLGLPNPRRSLQGMGPGFVMDTLINNSRTIASSVAQALRGGMRLNLGG